MGDLNMLRQTRITESLFPELAHYRLQQNQRPARPENAAPGNATTGAPALRAPAAPQNAPSPQGTKRPRADSNEGGAEAVANDDAGDEDAGAAEMDMSD